MVDSHELLLEPSVTKGGDYCFHIGTAGSTGLVLQCLIPFRYEILKMLKKEGKITDAVIENMLSWHHSGFNIYCGSAIWPHDKDAMENLARYIIHASFSQERMTYIPADQSTEGEVLVIYQSKDGAAIKTFHALDWLAQLITHIPNKNEQMVRYYGFYSNKSRGMHRKAANTEEVPALIHTEQGCKQFRKNWARLIQKSYEVDPLLYALNTGMKLELLHL